MLLENLDVFKVVHNSVASLCHDLRLSRLNASAVVPKNIVIVT